MHPRRSLPLLSLLLLISTAPYLTAANAATDCSKVACVDVRTENGRIVIEAKKGSGAVSATKKATPPTSKVSTPRPAVTKPPTPKPAAKKPATKKAAPQKPATKKPVAKKTVSTKPPTSLGDKLIEMVPTAGISYQPEYQPLIHVPVYFWCDLPDVFTKKVKIIGETIDVVMRPGFAWSFGDGSFKSTTDPGTSYPDGQITHTYSQPGTYIVTLITSWNGTFKHSGVERSITGDIKRTSLVTIKVVSAPSRFTR